MLPSTTWKLASVIDHYCTPVRDSLEYLCCVTLVTHTCGRLFVVDITSTKK
jgi:hypothetical protein